MSSPGPLWRSKNQQSCILKSDHLCVAIDSEFSHAGPQRAWIDVEDGRGAIFSFNTPICFPEHLEDVIALQIARVFMSASGAPLGLER
jgi:hypothetical protein